MDLCLFSSIFTDAFSALFDFLHVQTIFKALSRTFVLSFLFFRYALSDSAAPRMSR